MTNDKVFKVLMFGPNRVGKSSVLASMVDQLEKVKKKTGGEITLTPSEAAKKLLNNKKDILKKIFYELKDRVEENHVIDVEPTRAPVPYDFTLSVNGVEETFDISFIDINGEMLKDVDSSVRKKVVDLMHESSVIIIAIDTPHLMECNGQYNEPVNSVYQVMNLFQICNKEIYEQPKLVLFVPIKCEKYYHEKKMDEVNKRIKEKYRNVISLFAKPSSKEKYMVAITPILTLGDIVFDDFKRDENGDVVCIQRKDIVDEEEKIVGYENEFFNKRPMAAFYKFYGDNPTFSPEYCEQPLLYTLNFILKLAEVKKKPSTKKSDQKKKSGLQKAFEFAIKVVYLPGYLMYELFSLYKEMKEAVKIVAAEVKTEGDGYEIIQNPFEEEEKK